MHAFTDNAGRVHRIVINAASVKNCRGLTKTDERPAGINVYEFADPQKLGALLQDGEALTTALYALSDARERNIDELGFLREIAGDSYGAAENAFLEELADFFPDPQRTAIRKLIRKLREIQSAAGAQIDGLLDLIDVDKLTAEMRESVKTSLNGAKGLSGNAPESSELIPDRSRSAS
jgi:hypothetical protein